MRVGVIVRMEADTDINEKFAEVRAMGMESCQLVCWERKIINDEKAAEAILAAAEKHGSADPGSGPGRLPGRTGKDASGRL